jgi:hypothetical protein
MIMLAPAVLCMVSCYKEYVLYPNEGDNEFNFLMTEYQVEAILNSRDEKLVISSPDPVLYYNNTSYKTDHFQLRGESALHYRRKSFSVNLHKELPLINENSGQLCNFEKFKLISLVADYTYIENSVAIGFLKAAELWLTYSFYTEVKLNNNTQGVYLFIEDPVSFFLYKEEANFILRRSYNHTVSNYELSEYQFRRPAEYYLARFDSIYSTITLYSGEQLYDSLMRFMDLPQYFTKLSVDLLLKNGDYTDEVFFYSKLLNGHEVFGVYPWDYDDLFAGQPHEIGRDWAVGTVFGTRTYSSVDDIVADVGNKLLFSIEDDLDYIIAKDDYLYEKYLESLSRVMDVFTEELIDEVFSTTHEQLQPFYDQPEIIEQSKYDANETNQQLFDQNLNAKHQLVLERRNWIIQQLNDTKR